MEIKKIIILLTAVFIPLSVFLFSDISQYKQIGDTHFFLLPNDMGEESFLYHDGEARNMFYPINHKGIVHDVYWNQQFVIIKCSQQKEEYWYIMKNLKDYNYPESNLQQFHNKNDYQSALDSLGINEGKMQHTDGGVPWNLHLKR